MTQKSRAPEVSGPEAGGSALAGGAAVFSACGRYRWWLRRSWEPARPLLLFLGLNPSRADASHDDPTLRRLVGLARGWGFGAVEVLNLYGWISTSPAILRRAADPVGPDNDAWLRRCLAAQPGAPLWLGWGAAARRGTRQESLAPLLMSRELVAIGATAGGQPRHPLYAPARSRLRPWSWHDTRTLGHPGQAVQPGPPVPPCPAPPGATPSICT